VGAPENAGTIQGAGPPQRDPLQRLPHRNQTLMVLNFNVLGG